MEAGLIEKVSMKVDGKERIFMHYKLTDKGNRTLFAIIIRAK